MAAVSDTVTLKGPDSEKGVGGEEEVEEEKEEGEVFGGTSV